MRTETVREGGSVRRSRRSQTSIVVVALVTLVSLGLSGQAIAACPFSNASVYDGSVSNVEAEQSLLCQINRARKRSDLKLLKRDGDLAQAARKHSEDMVDHNYFDHQGRDGSSHVDRVRRTSYDGQVRSEIIASGYATPKDTFKGWMNSPPHRSAILDKGARLIGLGAAFKSNKARYTGVFGRR